MIRNFEAPLFIPLAMSIQDDGSIDKHIFQCCMGFVANLILSEANDDSLEEMYNTINKIIYQFLGNGFNIHSCTYFIKGKKVLAEFVAPIFQNKEELKKIKIAANKMHKVYNSIKLETTRCNDITKNRGQ